MLIVLRFYHIHRRSWAKNRSRQWSAGGRRLFHKNLFAPAPPGPRWGAYSAPRPSMGKNQVSRIFADGVEAAFADVPWNG